MSLRPSHPLQRFVHRIQVECFSVNRIARPFPIMFEFLVFRLEDDIQKLLVTVRSSNVFRWTTALTG